MLHNICKVKNVADILRNFEVVIYILEEKDFKLDRWQGRKIVWKNKDDKM